jgi:hypothetical protein
LAAFPLGFDTRRLEMTPRSKDHIFINYARADSDFADALYDLLKKKGFHPWMDRRDIFAGENWKMAINSAVENAAVFLAVISKNSVEKEGYVQVEIKRALDKRLEKIEGRIFIIPLRMEDCERPWFVEQYSLQVLDWDNGKNEKRLIESICMSYNQQKINVPACP